MLQVSSTGIHGQVVTCYIKRLEWRKEFYVSFIYDVNDKEDRQILWRKLKDLKSIIRNEAWQLKGDFNIIRYHYEAIGSKERDILAMEEFEGCIQCMDVDVYITKVIH